LIHAQQDAYSHHLSHGVEELTEKDIIQKFTMNRFSWYRRIEWIANHRIPGSPGVGSCGENAFER
jgi:hypothetical protein